MWTKMDMYVFVLTLTVLFRLYKWNNSIVKVYRCCIIALENNVFGLHAS